MRSKLPQGWKEVELGSIVLKFLPKTGKKAGEGLDKGKYKFFTSSTEQTKFIDSFDFDGEYLIFSTGGKAAVHYCNGKFSTSNDCFVVQIKKGISTKYIFYCLKSRIYILEAGFKGAGLKHLSRNYLESIKIPLPFTSDGKPDLKKQKQIVKILEKVEKLKQKREEAIKLADEYLKSVFYEMFMKKKEEFEEVKLGNRELFEIKGGKRLPLGDKFSETPTNRPYLRVTDMRNKTIVEGNIKYISEETFQKIKNYTISSEDVYITIAGTIGLAGTIPKKYNGASLTENAAKIVIKNKKRVDKIFLTWAISSLYVQNQIKQRIGIVGVPKLALFRIETLRIPLPPIKLQKKFASIVEKVEKFKEKQKKSKEEIERLFNALMSKAFNGELV